VTVRLIWAQAANGVIGRDNTIPWRLPEDQSRFRTLTTGGTVLMGRLTWESLPERFRPLPDRRNLVLTRDPDWTSAGAEPVHSIEDAIDRAGGDLWVIGGGAVYEAALPYARRAEVTELREEFEGDVLAPVLDDDWMRVSAQPDDGWHESASGLAYRYLRYSRLR